MKPVFLVFLGVSLVLVSYRTAAAEPAPVNLATLRAKAERGDPSAQHGLGLALSRSASTAEERIEASVWLTLAAENSPAGTAPETVPDTLSAQQRAEVRRRVDAARAANPSLRGATPIISVPAEAGVPVIVVPGNGPTLQDQLAAALKEKAQLASELTAAWKDAEQLKARLAEATGPNNLLTAAQKTIREAQANLSRQSTELATARTEAAAARLEITSLQAQLGTVREQLAATTDAKTKAEIALAASEQIAVARAEDLGRLRAAVTAQELAALRDRAAAAHEHETRVRQLEAEKASLAAAAATAGANAEELTRASNALADAEAKLATALRSYTLITAERDELRSQVTDLTAKLSAASEVRAAALAASPAPATPAPVAPTTETSPTRPSAPAEPGVRTHVIAVGDTLSSISRRYYGSANRWQEILAANRDVLTDERSLVAGKILRIP